jgi:hypothetical protein
LDFCLSFYLFVQANQKGINVHPKSMHANPHEWRACEWLGLGLCLSANSEQIIEREGFLFTKPKEAAGRCNKQLNSMLHQHAEEVSATGQLQALHSHSLRKGGAGKCANESDAFASIASICQRGDWALGKVLDTYFNWGQRGDQIVGRLLSCLPTGTSQFAAMPPHFTTTNAGALPPVYLPVFASFHFLSSRACVFVLLGAATFLSFCPCVISFSIFPCVCLCLAPLLF